MSEPCAAEGGGDDAAAASRCREMSLREYLRYWRGRAAPHAGGGQQTTTATAKSGAWYFKDWHLRAEHPHYRAYATPRFFRDDALNAYLLQPQPQPAPRPRRAALQDFRFVYCGPKGSWTPLHADVYRCARGRRPSGGRRPQVAQLVGQRVRAQALVAGAAGAYDAPAGPPPPPPAARPRRLRLQPGRRGGRRRRRGRRRPRRMRSAQHARLSQPALRAALRLRAGGGRGHLRALGRCWGPSRRSRARPAAGGAADAPALTRSVSPLASVGHAGMAPRGDQPGGHHLRQPQLAQRHQRALAVASAAVGVCRGGEGHRGRPGPGRRRGGVRRPRRAQRADQLRHAPARLCGAVARPLEARRKQLLPPDVRLRPAHGNAPVRPGAEGPRRERRDAGAAGAAAGGTAAGARGGGGGAAPRRVASPGAAAPPAGGGGGGPRRRRREWRAGASAPALPLPRGRGPHVSPGALGRPPRRLRPRRAPERARGHAVATRVLGSRGKAVPRPLERECAWGTAGWLPRGWRGEPCTGVHRGTGGAPPNEPNLTEPNRRRQGPDKGRACPAPGGPPPARLPEGPCPLPLAPHRGARSGQRR
eukprot:scaffold1648_cov269-Prasinococcus_capsulatus_cf.AAC.1